MFFQMRQMYMDKSIRLVYEDHQPKERLIRSGFHDPAIAYQSGHVNCRNRRVLLLTNIGSGKVYGLYHNVPVFVSLFWKGYQPINECHTITDTSPTYCQIDNTFDPMAGIEIVDSCSRRRWRCWCGPACRVCQWRPRAPVSGWRGCTSARRRNS